MTAITKRLVLLIVVPVLFGHVFGACLVRPAAYGSELAECERQATTWDDYTPCCTNVAHRYGRDPSFCWRDEDGGRQ
jgi:hypothetical protein